MKPQTYIHIIIGVIILIMLAIELCIDYSKKDYDELPTHVAEVMSNFVVD